MPVTLLLADDSATIQRVIEMTFAGEDIRVVTVDDGREAMERIAADAPDIVLADANMPEKDGYDVSAFVKADRALSHIPVVLLTGAFDPVDDERAREAGCDAVLVKPFEPKAVVGRVRELLGAPTDAAVGPAEGEAEASPETAVGDGAREAADEAGVLEAPSAAPEASTVSAGPAASEPVSAASGTAAAEGSPAAPELASERAASEPAAAGPAASEPVSAASETATAEGLPAAPERAASEPAAAGPVAPDVSPAAPGGAASPVPTDGAGAAAAAAAVPAVEAAPPPTLADAFAALLAAEQGDVARARAAYPWPRQAADDEALVERVAERVVERLSEEVTGELVSEVVARVAERLVRDQIGRIGPV